MLVFFFVILMGVIFCLLVLMELGSDVLGVNLVEMVSLFCIMSNKMLIFFWFVNCVFCNLKLLFDMIVVGGFFCVII